MSQDQETKVGFWKSKQEPHLPMPESGKPRTDKVEFLSKLSRVEAKAQVRAYKGMSLCRICGVSNGSEEYRYKGVVWPAGYRHYISEHDVAPDPAILKLVSK